MPLQGPAFYRVLEMSGDNWGTAVLCTQCRCSVKRPWSCWIVQWAIAWFQTGLDEQFNWKRWRPNAFAFPGELTNWYRQRVFRFCCLHTPTAGERSGNFTSSCSSESSVSQVQHSGVRVLDTSPQTSPDARIELRPPGLAASTFTHWDNLLALWIMSNYLPVSAGMGSRRIIQALEAFFHPTSTAKLFLKIITTYLKKGSEDHSLLLTDLKLSPCRRLSS